MSSADQDSMWLQRSITLPDPLPNDNGTPDARNGTEEHDASTRCTPSMPPPLTDKVPKASEMELTKMNLDSSSLLAYTQRPSMRYSSRASFTSGAVVSAQEYDDLRSRYSQAKRELLKASDTRQDMEFARFELTRAREELKLLRTSVAGLKDEVEEATQRADAEHRSRVNLQAKMESESAMRASEVDFLTRQLEELRRENAKRISELSEQQESENYHRLQSLRDDLASATEEMEGLALQVRHAEEARKATERNLEVARHEAAQALETKENLAQCVKDLTARCEELTSINESREQQLHNLEKESRSAQEKMTTTLVERITSTKDACIAELKDELQQAKEKSRGLSDELAALRHRNQQLEEELRQQDADHAKQLRRADEEHRLALCERQLQMEAAVREAKGGRSAADEENMTLRRQLAKVSSELSTVAAVLAQRETQLHQAEKESVHIRETLCRLEQENVALASDAEVCRSTLAEADERIRRLNEQKDSLEAEYSADLREAKEQLRHVEESLIEARTELSTMRQEQMKADHDGRTQNKQLRRELDRVTSECSALRADAEAKQRFEVAAMDYEKKWAAAQKAASDLTVELDAAVNRCTTLERRLEEELRRTIRRATSLSPASHNHTVQPLQQRSESAHNAQPTDSSRKRARTEDARVFAISGFDGNELLMNIKQLPKVAIAECKSNLPVPSNLTHLVTNGQLTIKLLTALVRGCWILPEKYILDSMKERRWLSEADFGFRHENPPLLKRHIALTEAFMSSKHYSTVTLLLHEGGAILENTADDAEIVLCTNHEVKSLENGMSWEKMVDLIYPVKVQ